MKAEGKQKMKGKQSWEVEQWLTFFINPFHGEKLLVVKGAHVSNFTAQSLEGDGRLKIGYHDVPKEEKNKLQKLFHKTTLIIISNTFHIPLI